MHAFQTQAALKLIHDAEELLPRLPKEKRSDLEGYIRSLASVVVLYLRVRHPEVPEAHLEAYQNLLTRLNQLKEAGWTEKKTF